MCFSMDVTNRSCGLRNRHSPGFPPAIPLAELMAPVSVGYKGSNSRGYHLWPLLLSAWRHSLQLQTLSHTKAA